MKKATVYPSRQCLRKNDSGKEGLFHGFGVDGWAVQDYGNQYVGVKNRTMAIIEFPDGTLSLEELDCVKLGEEESCKK